MKTFRLLINVEGVVFVDADRYEARAGRIVFYRESSIVAQFPAASVKEVKVSETMTQGFALVESEPSGSSSKLQAWVEESPDGCE